jgi:hypothetical protein
MTTISIVREGNLSKAHRNLVSFRTTNKCVHILIISNTIACKKTYK